MKKNEMHKNFTHLNKCKKKYLNQKIQKNLNIIHDFWVNIMFGQNLNCCSDDMMSRLQKNKNKNKRK